MGNAVTALGRVAAILPRAVRLQCHSREIPSHHSKLWGCNQISSFLFSQEKNDQCMANLTGG